MLNPGKKIFRYLTKLLKLKDEIECYTLYLDTALDFRLDFNSLSENLQTDKDIARSYYGSDNEEPRFFNYKNYTDWAKLNNCLMPDNEYLCFYEEKRYCNNGLKWVKIYDESTTTILLKNNPEHNLVRHCFILRHDKKMFVFALT